MSDPADDASFYEEIFTQAAIDAAINPAKEKRLAFSGICYNCEDPVTEPRRFCDKLCQEDWEYVEQRKRANGIS